MAVKTHFIFLSPCYLPITEASPGLVPEYYHCVKEVSYRNFAHKKCDTYTRSETDDFLRYSSWYLQKVEKMSILFRKFLRKKKVYREKLNTSRQSQRKILLNCHLRFLIFEILSQRFLATKLCKNRYFINKLVYSE